MNIVSLSDGIHLVSIALGCFGIAEITKNLDNKEQRSPFNGPIKLIPTWPEFKRIFPSALRGSDVLGYIFLRFKLEPAPLLLGFILGPMLEENFRRAMLISRGSFEPFLTHPIGAFLVGMIFLFFAWQLFSFLRKQWQPRVAL